MSKLLPFRHIITISGYNVLLESNICGHPHINSTVNCKQQQLLVKIYPKGFDQRCGDYVSIIFDTKERLEDFTFVDCTIAIVRQNGARANMKAFDFVDKEIILEEYVKNEDLINLANDLLNNGDLVLYLEGFLRSNNISGNIWKSLVMPTNNKPKPTTDIFNANWFPATESFVLIWTFENASNLLSESFHYKFKQVEKGGFKFLPNMGKSSELIKDTICFFVRMTSTQTVAVPFSGRFSIVDFNGKSCNYFELEMISTTDRQCMLAYEIDRENLAKQRDLLLPNNKLTVNLKITKIVEADIIDDLNEVDLSNYLRILSSIDKDIEANVTHCETIDAKTGNSTQKSLNNANKSEIELFKNETIATLNGGKEAVRSFKTKYADFYVITQYHITHNHFENSIFKNSLINNDSTLNSGNINIQEHPTVLPEIENIVQNKAASSLGQIEQKVTEFAPTNVGLRDKICVFKKQIQDIYQKIRGFSKEKIFKQIDFVSLVEKIELLIESLIGFVATFYTSCIEFFNGNDSTQTTETSSPETHSLETPTSIECQFSENQENQSPMLNSTEGLTKSPEFETEILKCESETNINEQKSINSNSANAEFQKEEVDDFTIPATIRYRVTTSSDLKKSKTNMPTLTKFTTKLQQNYRNIHSKIVKQTTNLQNQSEPKQPNQGQSSYDSRRRDSKWQNNLWCWKYNDDN